jgi:flagellar biosynthetic protein FlhB
MLVVSAVTLIVSGQDMIEQIGELARNGLAIDRRLIFDPQGAIEMLQQGVAAGLRLLAPFFLITFVVAILASVSLGGWSFSVEALTFKFEKLNPVAGLKRIFAWRGLMELAKSVAKFLLVGAVGALLLWSYADHFVAFGYQSAHRALANAGQILAWSFLALSAVLIVVAIIDVPFQLWDHARNLRMTRQEVKDEAKDTEGKPEVKSRVRQLQRELAQRRMMEAVPKADVVITNPTHFAVALKYEEGRMRAPRVVAKGSDLLANRIRAKASDHKVPIFSAPPLARALYYSTELDQEIPAGLYLAVAQVLAYVYQLKTAGRYGGEVPRPPQELNVPPDLYRGPVP